MSSARIYQVKSFSRSQKFTDLFLNNVKIKTRQSISIMKDIFLSLHLIMGNQIHRCLEVCTFTFPWIKFPLIFCPSFILTILIFSWLIFLISFVSFTLILKFSAQTTIFFFFKTSVLTKGCKFPEPAYFWRSIFFFQHTMYSPFVVWLWKDDFPSIELLLPSREEKHSSFSLKF